MELIEVSDKFCWMEIHCPTIRFRWWMMTSGTKYTF